MISRKIVTTLHEITQNCATLSIRGRSLPTQSFTIDLDCGVTFARSRYEEYSESNDTGIGRLNYRLKSIAFISRVQLLCKNYLGQKQREISIARL